MHHFKNKNNRYHIKLCSNKGRIYSGYTSPNLTLEEVKQEAREVWSENFMRHKKWLQIADCNGEIVFKHDNLK